MISAIIGLLSNAGILHVNLVFISAPDWKCQTG